MIGVVRRLCTEGRQERFVTNIMSGCPFHNKQRQTEDNGRKSTTARIGNEGRTSNPSNGHAGGPTEDDLECPVCLRLLYLPSSLPCGHTFCTPCLGRTIQHQQQSASSEMSSMSGATFRCPVCRAGCCGTLRRFCTAGRWPHCSQSARHCQTVRQRS